MDVVMGIGGSIENAGLSDCRQTDAPRGRNHQGKENLILFPVETEGARNRKAAVRCRERLGGLLKYYEREAA
jgi:hypothetical protein